MLACIAKEPMGILVVIFGVVTLLCGYQYRADANGGDFVAAHATVENFFGSSSRVEVPEIPLCTSGMGVGQFSAPMYKVVVPSGSFTRRCIS